MVRSGHPKQCAFWVNWSMESVFAGEFVNRKATGILAAATYAYAKVELVGSNVAAVAITNSSTLPVSQAN
jgi:hypothetical protein